MTQKDIAVALKTYQQNVAGWESGKKTPNMYTIMELSRYLRVTAGQLLGLEDF